ncbi:hypothetical protein CO046_04285 [Candidatus Peregrinibacteria bacterium CG_4_9_14_0_2_um_filter_53_11]|nr:MAG: hypothetical protein CO046_04285 [Candidatus Peregrinibacteria bacterium CG_4_9_14_0_2_um_filter_53_11]
MKISKSTLKQFLLVTTLTVMGLLLINGVGISPVFAQAIDPEQDQPAIVRSLSGGQTGIRGIVLTIVNFFLTFLGLLAVVMVIYGGFLYVGSAGNDDNIGKAKKILLYAAIGILIIIASYAMVNTILGAATGGQGV